MKGLRRLITILLCIIVCYYIIFENDLIKGFIRKNISNGLNESKISLQLKTLHKEENNLLNWIDKSSTELVEAKGKPERKDLSAYGYTWWIYPDTVEGYLQFGMDENNNIETIYARGSDLPFNNMRKKTSYEQINEYLLFENEVSYWDSLSIYTFHLTDDDILQRPLVYITDDVFIQFYFDTFTNELSSFRILKADVLLKHKPYEIKYRGKLPEKPHFNDEQWQEIERGMELQIYDVTNFIRSENQIGMLSWEKNLHQVAFMHSKDMKEKNYFSHDGLDGDGLKERLASKGVLYHSAGENIAAQYPDGLAAVEGWLNSGGHREALLEKNYTHIGVGVYRLYFTQNFINRPE